MKNTNTIILAVEHKSLAEDFISFIETICDAETQLYLVERSEGRRFEIRNKNLDDDAFETLALMAKSFEFGFYAGIQHTGTVINSN